jgi:aminoglycoside 6'-N-acetyltransferase I
MGDALQPSDPQIRRARATDRLEWLRLRMALWPEALPRELEEELDAMLADAARQAVFVWDRGWGLGGLLEATLRPWAEGCSSSPVAYVAGGVAVDGGV